MQVLDPVLDNLRFFAALAPSPTAHADLAAVYQPARELARRLLPGSQVLVLAPEPEAHLALWREFGHVPQSLTAHQDPRLLSLPRGSLDAVWAPRGFNFLPEPACQRVLALIFTALKPEALLFVSIADSASDRYAAAPFFKAYADTDFASLLLQSGFVTLARGQSEARVGDPAQRGWITRRVSNPTATAKTPEANPPLQ